MKKLMVLTAAVVAIATANAASLKWTVARQAWGTADGVAFEGDKGGKVWAFLESDLSAVESALKSAATADDIDFKDIAVKDAQTFSNAKGAAGGTLSSGTLEAGIDYSVFFVALSKDSSSYLISNPVSGRAYTVTNPSQGITAGWSSDVPVTSVGGWTPVGVPEPTSALLVLAGLAGLALRRRRA